MPTSAQAPTAPAPALWVEVTEVDEPEPTDETRTLAAEYKKLLLAMLQRREAWQIIDFVNQLTDPSALADTAGYASYLTQVQKRQLLETPDVAERLRALIDWTGDHLAEVEVNDKIAEDVREGMEKHAEGIPAAPAAGRDPQGTWRGRTRRIRRLPEPASRPPICPRRSARPHCARSASWSAPASRARRAAGSAPGWTPCWTCRGTSRTEDSTDLKAAREILDADHHGLDDVKDRIVEYLAVRARRAQRGVAGRRRPRIGRRDGAGRSPRRRQDVAG